MSLVSEVQKLVDESGGATWWIQQQVFDACNEALQEDWALMRPAAGTSAFSVSTGTDIFTFDTAAIMIPQYFVYDTLGVKLFPTVHDELENWSRRWRGQAAARPQWMVQWDAAHYRVFPTPNATYSFTLWGVPWPVEIGTSTQDATLETFQRKAVILRAAALLLDLTQPDLADAYRAEASDHAKRAIANTRGQFDSNVDRMRPGTGWAIAQNGRIGMGRKYR